MNPFHFSWLFASVPQDYGFHSFRRCRITHLKAVRAQTARTVSSQSHRMRSWTNDLPQHDFGLEPMSSDFRSARPSFCRAREIRDLNALLRIPSTRQESDADRPSNSRS